MTQRNNPLPDVSIILPAYNAAPFLKESLDSVLRQSYANFELIALNDGSSDDTGLILDEYAKRDNRVKVIHQENLGLVATLNKGIGLARAPLIARIDGDDPWMDDKLSEQVDAFTHDPELVLIGGGFEIINTDGYYLETVMPPLDDEDIRRTLYLRNAFGHSGVVFKKEAAETAGLYSSDHGPTEDYDLWIRLSQQGKVANLARPVYRYRINLEGISQMNSEKQMIFTKRHAEEQWSSALPSVLSRSELKARSEAYLKKPSILGLGVLLKNQLLADNAQIGIKLLRRRQYANGIKQLIAVCSTGRTGVKMTIERIKKLDSGSLRQSRDSFEHNES